VSIAGILANLLLAMIGFVVLKLRFSWLGLMSEGLAEPVLMFLEFLLTMNISLAVFNLLPFPPLDGSKVLETFLPEGAQPVLALLEQYGYLILMVLMYTGFFGAIIGPILDFVYSQL
jgi:Zn-dependent protease